MSAARLTAPVRLLASLGLALAVTAGLAVSPSAPSAQAITASEGRQAINVVASRAGMPYVYGAEGPRSFDCSGLTQWTFRQIGESLPRTAAQQRAATPRIPTRALRPGDLVFFHSGSTKSNSNVYHVGIYAGNWQIWDAPKPGRVVSKRTIWANSGLTWGRVS